MHLRFVCFITSGLFWVLPIHAESSGPPLFECTPERMVQCEIQSKRCDEIPVLIPDVPQKLRIDLKKKITQTFEGPDLVSSATIDRVDYHDDQVMFQGFKMSSKHIETSFVWTAVVAYSSGRMTVTAVTDGAGYILFGTCRFPSEQIK